MRNGILCVGVAVAVFLISGCGPAPSPVDTGKPAAMHQGWAVKCDGPLPNFYKVSENLYRGGKPSGEGISHLKDMGVKTVVDLGSAFFEVDNLNDPKLVYCHIPCSALSARDDQVIEFLKAATDTKNGPVYVHCRRGADRTGFMVACYRVAVQGWGREAAVSEMTSGGFGFDSTYTNLVAYVRTRDFDGLCRQAGIKTAQAPVAAVN